MVRNAQLNASASHLCKTWLDQRRFKKQRSGFLKSIACPYIQRLLILLLLVVSCFYLKAQSSYAITHRELPRDTIDRLKGTTCLQDSLAPVQTQINQVQSPENSDFTAYKYYSPEPLRFTPHQLVTPGILLGTGITLDLFKGAKNTQNSWRNDKLGNFHTAVDNMLLFAPIALPYGLDLIGIHSKTDIANRTAILLKGEVLLLSTGILLKHSIKEWRPDHSNHYSFPSGHSMQIFATATLLSEEYKGRYPWMPYAAFGIASGVGLLRLANNKHYLGDVLSGAALGILSMKLAYWTHQYKWKRFGHLAATY